MIQQAFSHVSTFSSPVETTITLGGQTFVHTLACLIVIATAMSDVCDILTTKGIGTGIPF